MAWLKSHSNLEKHHKLIRLQTAMRWSRNEAVGFLHRFWWSVMEVSESGDVTSLALPEVLSETLNMKPDVVQEVIPKMIECGFIEKHGERLRVHDWLDYAGEYLTRKYKTKKRYKLVDMWAFYGLEYGEVGEEEDLGKNKGRPKEVLDKIRLDKKREEEQKDKNIVASPLVTQEIEIPPDLMENQTEIRLWLEYKREKGQKYKPTGLKALWKVLREMPQSERAQSINSSMASNYTGIFNNGGKNATNSYGQNAPVVGSAKPIPGKYANIGIHVKQSENESCGSVFNDSWNTKTGVK